MGGEVQSRNIADIEVTMVESHANLKVRTKKRPKQLLKMVSSLHGLCLTILHLNVTTADEFVFYSISVKVIVCGPCHVFFFFHFPNSNHFLAFS
jgi:hypothetical protein